MRRAIRIVQHCSFLVHFIHLPLCSYIAYRSIDLSGVDLTHTQAHKIT